MRIQRKDAVRAKNIPRASILNLISSPGRTVTIAHSMTLPSSIVGSIETIKPNLVREAKIVHVSRRFGLLLDISIRAMAQSGTTITKKGMDE